MTYYCPFCTATFELYGLSSGGHSDDSLSYHLYVVHEGQLTKSRGSN